VKDVGVGFLHTLVFAVIVVAILGGVMLIVNYLAAPVVGGAY
jgi:hypothetical protein